MIIVVTKIYCSLVEYLIEMLGILPLVLFYFLFKKNCTMRTNSLIRLSDGHHVKTSPLTKDEFIDLSNKAKDYLIAWENEIYVLKDGSIVYTTHFSNREYYGWFSSLNDMRRLEEDRINQKSSRHFFEGYNSYQEHFPDKIDGLIKEIIDDLGLISENLEIDENLIQTLDKAILYQDDPQIFMINHIMHLSAVIGKVYLSQNSSAEWYMQRDADGETWVPEIKINRAKGESGTIDFVHWLYRDITHYAGVGNVLESSYLSLGDFSNLNLLTTEKDHFKKIKVTPDKVKRD